MKQSKAKQSKAPVEEVVAGVVEELSYGLEMGLPSVKDVRFGLRGVNVDSKGNEFPRVTRGVFDSLNVLLEKANDSVLDYVLSRFCKPGSTSWCNYMATRAGRRVQREDGFGDYTVVKSVAPRYVPPWERAAMKKKDVTAQASGVKVKHYTLSQILTDSYIRDKYEIPVRLVNSLRTLACTAPADAAATAAEFLQLKSPGVKIEVAAADYSSGVAAARRSIRMLASQQPAVSADVAARVIGKELFVFGDEDSEDEWCVRGPLAYAESVMDVFRLAMYGGRHEVIHLFPGETAKLRIDVFIGRDCVSPTVIGHVGGSGFENLASNQETLKELSESGLITLQELGKGVVPVTEGGVVRSSAVQLERRAILFNQHVLEEAHGEVQVAGVGLTTSVVLAQDVWMARIDGLSVPWKFRSPVVGERVFILYHNGVEAVVSPVFKVISTDGAQVMSELVTGVGPGMSGGAVLAVSDLSLLAVHQGASIQRLVSARVTSTMYEDVCEVISDEVGERSSQVGASLDSTAVVNLFNAKGIDTQLKNVVLSCRPVYDGPVHRGTALQVGKGQVVTACTEGVVDFEGELSELVVQAGSFLRTARLDAESNVGRVRVAELYETVVVVGLDSQGPYVSGFMRVRHCGPYGKNFLLSADVPIYYPMQGGVVVSAQDGAVIGMVVQKCVSQKVQSYFCVPLPTSGLSEQELLRGISRVFPALECERWEAADVSAAFDLGLGDQESASKLLRGKAWSKLGESQLRTRVYKVLSDADVDVSVWELWLERAIAEKKIVRLVDELGLDKLVAGDRSVSRPWRAREKAEILFSMVALVNRHEGDVQVESWLSMLGLLPVVEGNRVEFRPSLMRRPSELGLISDDGRILLAVDDLSSVEESDLVDQG